MWRTVVVRRGVLRLGKYASAVHPTLQVLDPVILAPRATSLLLRWQSASHGQLSLQVGGKCSLSRHLDKAELSAGDPDDSHSWHRAPPPRGGYEESARGHTQSSGAGT